MTGFLKVRHTAEAAAKCWDILIVKAGRKLVVPSGREKVRRLLDSVKCPRLEVAKTACEAVDKFHEDFDAVAEFLQGQVTSQAKSSRNVSDMTVNQSKKVVDEHGRAYVHFQPKGRWRKNLCGIVVRPCGKACHRASRLPLFVW